MQSSNLILRGIARVLRGQGGQVALGLLLLLLQSLATVPVAWIVKRIFDTYLPAHDQGSLLIGGFAILALMGIAQGASLLGRRIVVRSVKVGTNRLREEFVAKLYLLPRTYYDRQDKFRLHETIVNDVERLDGMAVAIVGRMLPAGIVALTLAVVAAWLNWRLFTVVLVIFPVLYLSNRYAQKHHLAAVARFRRDFAAASRGVMMALRHVELTKLNATEAFELERQQQRFNQSLASGVKTAQQHEGYLGLQQFTLVILTLAILIVGGVDVARDSMTLGELLSFYAVVGLLANSLREVATGISLATLGYGALLNVLHFLELDARPPYAGTRSIAFGGRLALRDVGFRYAAGPERPLLAGVNLQTQPGTLTVLTGPNGAGKSTIIHLLLGLYRPTQGGVSADGQSYDDLDLTALRRQIGVVTQEPAIFEGTVAENIAYGAPPASAAAIESAARLATAHEFIVALPQGYATPVGDAGTRLSGGQRQRLAIARALLRQPALLIFDEPTSNLDGEAARQLLHNLRSLAPAPAILAVTHSVEVIRVADAVYHMADGKAVAVAAHARPFEPASGR